MSVPRIRRHCQTACVCQDPEWYEYILLPNAFLCCAKFTFSLKFQTFIWQKWEHIYTNNNNELFDKMVVTNKEFPIWCYKNGRYKIGCNQNVITKMVKVTSEIFDQMLFFLVFSWLKECWRGGGKLMNEFVYYWNVHSLWHMSSFGWWVVWSVYHKLLKYGEK